MIQHHDAAPDSKIFEAQYIGTAECKDQQHFRSPHADAFQFHQFGNHLGVGTFRQRIKCDRSGQRGIRYSTQIFDLSSGKTAAAQGFCFRGQKVFCGNRPQQLLDPFQNNSGNPDRQLL